MPPPSGRTNKIHPVEPERVADEAEVLKTAHAFFRADRRAKKSADSSKRSNPGAGMTRAASPAAFVAASIPKNALRRARACRAPLPSVLIGGHFAPAVRSALFLLQGEPCNAGKKLHDLLGEAINDLCAKYSKPRPWRPVIESENAPAS